MDEVKARVGQVERGIAGISDGRGVEVKQGGKNAPKVEKAADKQESLQGKLSEDLERLKRDVALMIAKPTTDFTSILDKLIKN